MRDPLWELAQKGYDVSENRKYETLFTLANGYKGLRGTLEFSKIGEKGSFIAGVFDKSTAQVTELVNIQDSLGFSIYLEEEQIDMERCELLNFNRILNMKKGMLTTYLEVKTKSGKIVRINSERFVSRNNVHRWAVKYTIVPVNFKGKIFFENVIDGTMVNNALNPAHITKHFKVTEAKDINPGIALLTCTLDKNIKIVEASMLVGKDKNGNLLKERKFNKFGERVRELYQAFVEESKEYTVYKYGITYTSKDTNSCILSLSKEGLNSFLKDGFEKELKAHEKRWSIIWEHIDIKIKGDIEAQLGIRFNLYHLAASAYEGDERVSIAAKALHGEGYKGHVFWDTETFMLPFFIYTEPEVAKALLMYRYNTLSGARENARLNGYKGAQFPWESADDGIEVTPKWGFDYYGNPVRIWTGDEEYHINSDITFAIWEYYRATGDNDFMLDYGLEIFFDTAKFWQSRVEYNILQDRYEINKVIGPDEFHEHVNNNVYTNYLAKWSLNKTLELVRWIKNEDKTVYDKLCTKLGLDDNDFIAWKDIAEKMYIPRSKDGKLIEQFEGYFDLEYIPILEHDENGMPVWPEKVRLDRLGETQLIKQPDIIMLMLMLPEEFDLKTKKENYRYYEARTMHKSSLSPSMYSIMGLSVGDTENSYRYFMKAILTDISDNQGNTDFGFHAASAGGTWQSVVFGFGGFSVSKEGVPNFNPWVPDEWEEISFNMYWKNALIKVTARHNELELIAEENTNVKIYGNEYLLLKGNTILINR